MKTFTAMAEEWIRQHASSSTIRPEVPDAVPSEKFDPLDELREPFTNWFDSRVRLDRRWSTTVGTLYDDVCDWMLDGCQTVAPTQSEFHIMLQELGCNFLLIGDVELVRGIGLREDMEARQAFDVSVDSVAKPVAPATAQACPLNPPAAYRIIRQELGTGPVRLSRSEVIVDTRLFVESTLRQLDHALHGRTFLSGNWGVEGLLSRLSAVGCIVELEEARKAKQ